MRQQISDINALQNFLADHRKVVVLTGAGISAPSGIPTYRDQAGVWQHSEPIKHQEFIDCAATRQRYWARSVAGWPTVRDARPNEAHQALNHLEAAGKASLLITQNVDRLHQRAGSRRVIDLHGRMDRVRCLHCHQLYPRQQIQLELTANLEQSYDIGSAVRPDGDADVSDERTARIKVPQCTLCNGTLMPDVVFFGGTVPRERVQSCFDALEQADGLLVVGSSLQVFSGFRFCRRAVESGKTLALINPGTTRADSIADLKLDAECGPLLRRACAALH